MIEYQEIPVTDWRQLKEGDTIKWVNVFGNECKSTVIKREPDHYQSYWPIRLDTVCDGTLHSGWLDVKATYNVRKLIKIDQPNSQTMNTTNYSPELLQVIKSKNAWVIAAVTQNGQLDFTVSQSMEQSEPAAKGKIEQLSKQHPGVIFTTFKLQHAVRQQPAQIVVK